MTKRWRKIDIFIFLKFFNVFDDFKKKIRVIFSKKGANHDDGTGQHYLFSGRGGRGGACITAKWCLYKKLGTPLLLQTKFTAKS